MIEGLHNIVKRLTHKEKAMGSSDMADALKYAMMRTKEAVHQDIMMAHNDTAALKDQYIKDRELYLQKAMSANAANANALGQGGIYATAYQAPAPDPNNIPAYAMPLRDLVAMWELKFGDTWVAREVTNADEFWRPGVTRLNNNGLLESFPQNSHVRLKDGVRRGDGNNS